MHFLQIQIKMLSFIGYSLNKNEKYYWLVYACVNWILLAIICLPELHFVINNASNIQLATDALCTLLTSILSLSKLITLQMKRTSFYNLIFKLNELWSKGT